MSTTAMALDTVLAYDKMPESVMGSLRTLGGWFVFLANFFAALHLIFLGAVIAYEKTSNSRKIDIPMGEWFTKIMIGVWVCAAAGDIAAAVLLV